MEHNQQDEKRRLLAQQIFQEVQEGYYQSPMDFFKSMYNELENTSDAAIDILLRQRNSYD